MATKKISELEAITSAEDSDVLVVVDVSTGTTNKITKGNLLIGSGHSITMEIDSDYKLTLKLKNAAGTELSTASIDLPNEDAITNIEYSNGNLVLTKQSGATSQVDISGLIEGLVTESDFNTFTQELEQTIQGINETIGAINVKNLAQDEAIEELQAKNAELEQENEDLRDNQIFGQASGTEIYISDSAKAKVRSIGLTGRSTQESTTGKNKLPNELTTGANGVTVTKNNDGTVTLNGTANGITILMIGHTVLNSGNYILTGCPSGGGEGTYRLQLTDYPVNLNKGYDSGSGLSFSSDGIEYAVRINIANGTTFNNVIFKPMIRLSTVTDATYEPYTGGEASPNPNYPKEIKNCGDNGSVNEKVQSKNKLDYTKAKPGGSTPVTLIENGFNAKGKFAGQIVVEGLKKNTNYYLSYVRQIITGSTSAISVYAGTTQSTTIKTFSGNGTFNTGNNTTVNIWFYVGNGTNSGEANFTNIQLEEGTVKTDYTEYKAPQTLSFPLEQGQKLMQGDYLADDGVHHKRYQYEMNGVDNDLKVHVVSQYNGIYYCVCVPLKKPKTQSIGLSSHFKFVTWSITPGKCYCTSPNVIFTLEDQTITTIEQANAWLAEQKANGTPVTFQIVVQEEYLDPYTEEQKTAWEQIKKLRTYKGVTYISSEDETPANVDIEYVVDTKAYIDNELENIKNAIISLGGNV